MKKQRLHKVVTGVVVAATLAVAGAVPGVAFAQEPGAEAAPGAGFYGGVMLRRSGAASVGINAGSLANAWGRFLAPVADDNPSRALVFGGYRWRNDVTVEAALATADRFTLAPLSGGRGGVGLSLHGAADAFAQRTWNADVYGTVPVYKTVSFYGRLGYAGSDQPPAYALTGAAVGSGRLKDGVNYGLGLRYDVTPSLGLRVEYARFGRFAGETAGTGFMPDGDQVQFGMQYRF